MNILSQTTRIARYLGLALLLGLLAGCSGGTAQEPEIVWGRRGVRPGDLVRPRAIAIDSEDRLFIVDFTARIQVFDRDGKFLDHSWTTPDYRNGRPSGLGIARDGNLLVCDSHYHCLRIYTPQGKLLWTIGERLDLGYVSDAVQDEDGNFFLAEFGEKQRISKLDRDGKLLRRWGSAGSGPGQFARVRALALGPDGLLYVADACNHRIQVFTRDGEHVRCFGEPGSEPGQLSYPYDLAFAPTGELYVVEYDNHRVQKLTTDGRSLGCWGGPGRSAGRLHNPWALAVDSKGRVHVVDTENHRVQRIRF
jgi:DNA-binding beta-propeller fold protein YncE